MRVTFLNRDDFSILFLCEALGVQIKSKEALEKTLSQMKSSEVLRFFDSIQMIFKIEDFPPELYYEVGSFAYTNTNGITVLRLSVDWILTTIHIIDDPNVKDFYNAIVEAIEPIYWIFNLVRSLTKDKFVVHTKI